MGPVLKHKRLDISFAYDFPLLESESLWSPKGKMCCEQRLVALCKMLTTWRTTGQARMAQKKSAVRDEFGLNRALPRSCLFGSKIGMPDWANKNAEHPVKFISQVIDNCYMGCIYTKKLYLLIWNPDWTGHLVLIWQFCHGRGEVERHSTCQ